MICLKIGCPANFISLTLSTVLFYWWYNKITLLGETFNGSSPFLSNYFCRTVVIEIICSDETEHRQHVETRESDITGLQLPAWEQIKNREYDSWETECVRIDAAHRTVEESFRELIEKINKYCIK